MGETLSALVSTFRLICMLIPGSAITCCTHTLPISNDKQIHDILFMKRSNRIIVDKSKEFMEKVKYILYKIVVNLNGNYKIMLPHILLSSYAAALLQY